MKEQMVFRNGSNSVPPEQRLAQDFNYLSGWFRITGLCLLGGVWLVTIAFMVLIFVFRNDAGVVRSQPFCLALLFVESLHTSLRRDEGAGLSRDALSAMCNSTMWFFFPGHIITFAALATKLYRVDKVRVSNI